jgi:hypothetical protein
VASGEPRGAGAALTMERRSAVAPRRAPTLAALAAETRLTPLRAPPPALALSGRPISGGGLAAVAMAAVPVATTAVARR